jgi:hypothetical protein
MSDWNGTGDQYVVDRDSRYPLFSDIQTTDKSINAYQSLKGNPALARSFENQYLNSAQGIPSYYPCRCGACPNEGDWPRRPRMRPTIAPNDALGWAMDGHFGPGYSNLGYSRGAEYQTNPPPVPPPSSGLGNFQVDGSVLVMVFMFLMIVFIVFIAGRTFNELKEQIKKLNKNKT